MTTSESYMKDYIKIDLTETGRENVDFIKMAQNRAQ